VPALAGFLLMHRYAWARLVRAIRVSRRAGAARSPGSSCCSPRSSSGVFVSARYAPSGWLVHVVIDFGFAWLGFLFYLAVILAAARRAGFRPEAPPAPARNGIDVGRRVFLARAAAAPRRRRGRGTVAIGGRAPRGVRDHDARDPGAARAAAAASSRASGSRS
jgi:hypothetical protein